MCGSASASTIAKLLLSGPRGRRFLMEYALASDLEKFPVRTEGTFGYAAVHASSLVDPDEMTASAPFGWVGSEAHLVEVSPAEVAERLETLELLEPTPQLLRKVLAAAVDSARYWQGPEGDDVLAARPEMYRGLQRVAIHVAASPFTAWWCAPASDSVQYSVWWDDALPGAVPDDVHAALLEARHHIQTDEQIARRERDPDPTANWSGEWWSHPLHAMLSSTRLLFDGSPAGLWFVEDSLGWERAQSVRLIVPDDVSVFEIQAAADWAGLCARFPLEVTAQKRHDWYRTTGHMGRWVIPDWVQVAEHYDAVHLQVGAYLSAAGVAIPIDDNTGTASVIAGWAPDETYWISSSVSCYHEYIQWEVVDDGTDRVWKPKSAEPSPEGTEP